MHVHFFTLLTIRLLTSLIQPSILPVGLRLQLHRTVPLLSSHRRQERVPTASDKSSYSSPRLAIRPPPPRTTAANQRIISSQSRSIPSSQARNRYHSGNHYCSQENHYRSQENQYRSQGVMRRRSESNGYIPYPNKRKGNRLPSDRAR